MAMSLEQRLDALYDRPVIPVWELPSLAREVYSLDQTRKDAIRIFQKFTWLNVYPRDYGDGLWASFEAVRDDDIWAELGLA